MTDTVYMVTEWLGDYDDPILIFENMADASEYCARENRLLKGEIDWVETRHYPFDYEPIQIQREEKHVGI